jgi:hypothetical protein
MANGFFKTEKTAVELIKTKEQLIRQKTKFEVDKRAFENKVVQLKIIETSNLILNYSIQHPFVRVHIVNLEKGCYIQKIDP